jgi:hypothetical protein
MGNDLAGTAAGKPLRRVQGQKMTTETKFALSLLFVFCVGSGLIFVGLGAGKLAAFFAGAAFVLFATHVLAALVSKK